MVCGVLVVNCFLHSQTILFPVISSALIVDRAWNIRFDCIRSHDPSLHRHDYLKYLCSATKYLLMLKYLCVMPEM